jgi:hypothetical protein
MSETFDRYNYYPHRYDHEEAEARACLCRHMRDDFPEDSPGWAVRSLAHDCWRRIQYGVGPIEAAREFEAACRELQFDPAIIEEIFVDLFDDLLLKSYRRELEETSPATREALQRFDEEVSPILLRPADLDAVRRARGIINNSRPVDPSVAEYYTRGAIAERGAKEQAATAARGSPRPKR